MQAIKVGDRAYGTQSHFELTRHMLMAWTLEDPELQFLGHSTLLVQFEAIKQEYTANGKLLFENFLKIAGIIQ